MSFRDDIVARCEAIIGKNIDTLKGDLNVSPEVEVLPQVKKDIV